MKRYGVFLTAAAILALALGCSGPDDRIVLKVAHNGSIEHPYQIGFEAFKNEVETGTNGTVEVQIFENG